MITILQQEIEWMQIDQRIHSRVKKSISKDQENYFKNQKLKAIQQELGDEDLENGVAEAEKLKEQVEKLGLPADSKEKVLAEVNRLRLMPPMSAESTVIRSYIEWVTELPWKKKSNQTPVAKRKRHSMTTTLGSRLSRSASLRASRSVIVLQK